MVSPTPVSTQETKSDRIAYKKDNYRSSIIGNSSVKTAAFPSNLGSVGYTGHITDFVCISINKNLRVMASQEAKLNENIANGAGGRMQGGYSLNGLSGKTVDGKWKPFDVRSDYGGSNLTKERITGIANTGTDAVKKVGINLDDFAFSRMVKTNEVICLPMPTGQKVADYGINYEEVQTDAATASFVSTTGSSGAKITARRLLPGVAAGMVNVAQQGLSNVTKNVGGMIGGVASAVNTGIDAARSGRTDWKQLLDKATGQVENNRAEQVFQGVKFRDYRLEWVLYPSSVQEKDQILRILYLLKTNALPGIENSDKDKSFLNMPSEFDVEFYHYNIIDDGSKIPVINHNVSKYMTSVITNISVNESIQGEWAAFVDGAPVGIALSISFREVVPLNSNLIHMSSQATKADVNQSATIAGF